jgi:hypothetical protein
MPHRHCPTLTPGKAPGFSGSLRLLQDLFQLGQETTPIRSVIHLFGDREIGQKLGVLQYLPLATSVYHKRNALSLRWRK